MLKTKWQHTKSIYTPQPPKVTKLDESPPFGSSVSGGVYMNESKTELSGAYKKEIETAAELTKLREQAICNRMEKAIRTIEKVYDPYLVFEGASELRRQELESMELCGLETIDAWEVGWLRLIAEMTVSLRTN